MSYLIIFMLINFEQCAFLFTCLICRLDFIFNFLDVFVIIGYFLYKQVFFLRLSLSSDAVIFLTFSQKIMNMLASTAVDEFTSQQNIITRVNDV